MLTVSTGIVIVKTLLTSFVNDWTALLRTSGAQLAIFGITFAEESPTGSEYCPTSHNTQARARGCFMLSNWRARDSTISVDFHAETILSVFCCWDKDGLACTNCLSTRTALLPTASINDLK